MRKSLRCALAALAIVGFIGVATAQKKSESSLECREWRGNDRLQGHCEIKEQTIPAAGIITVDGKELEFSGGFGNLHTRVYEEVLAGRGFGIDDARPSIALTHRIRHTPVAPPRGAADLHPLLVRQ